MRHPWEPEVELTPDRARSLVERQFPALAPARLEVIGAGWDNLACLVNGAWVFRFPRRDEGRPLMENETRWLGSLAPRLPLPVPVPRWFGAPEGDYPYPFAGYRLVPGATACSTLLSDGERAACAEPLARFLAALHGIPVDGATARDGPRDLHARTDLPGRAEAVFRRMEEMGPTPGLPAAEVRDALEGLREAAPWSGGPRWVHGDFYARHILLDGGRRPCGVIDWGDLHLGDPAIDLSIAYAFLPPEAREGFFSGYGPVDAATRDRARFRALFYGVMLIHFGRTSGDGTAERIGRTALKSGLPPGHAR